MANFFISGQITLILSHPAAVKNNSKAVQISPDLRPRLQILGEGFLNYSDTSTPALSYNPATGKLDRLKKCRQALIARGTDPGGSQCLQGNTTI